MKARQLEQLIDKHDKKKRVEERERDDEDKKFQQEAKEFWENDKKLAPEKQTLLDKIVSWRDEFTKTAAFRKLFRKNNEIIIFYHSWGHRVPRFGGPGCWSRVCLEKTGELRYAAGYKWMGYNCQLGESQFTQKLSYDYLKAFASHIETEKVYETIASKLSE